MATMKPICEAVKKYINSKPDKRLSNIDYLKVKSVMKAAMADEQLNSAECKNVCNAFLRTVLQEMGKPLFDADGKRASFKDLVLDSVNGQWEHYISFDVARYRYEILKIYTYILGWNDCKEKYRYKFNTEPSKITNQTHITTNQPLSSSYLEAVVRQYKETIRQKEEMCSTLQEQKKKLLDDYDNVNEELENYKYRYDILVTEYNKIKQTGVNIPTQEIERYKITIAEYECKMKEAKSVIDFFKKKHIQTNNEVTNLKNSIDSANAQIKKYQDDIEQYQEDIDKLNQQRIDEQKNYESNINEMKSNIGILNEKIKNLENATGRVVKIDPETFFQDDDMEF